MNSDRKRVPPHVFFLTSAVFHYLGPACAVLLFARVDVLGVAWLRIASAGAVFALWLGPWKLWPLLRARPWTLLALGTVLAVMNTCFYLALARLPLGTVGAIEFAGPVALAALGVRTRRNLVALALAIGGVYLLTDVRLAGEPLGFVFAFANCALFVLYVVIGHRVAADGGGAGVQRLGAAMLVATLVVTPVGLGAALPVFTNPLLLVAGIAVGVCSSVIPYVCDQLAMARLPRATFALMLSLLPATAVIIGVIVLGQVPTPLEIVGVGLIVAGVATHQDRAATTDETAGAHEAAS